MTLSDCSMIPVMYVLLDQQLNIHSTSNMTDVHSVSQSELCIIVSRLTNSVPPPLLCLPSSCPRRAQPLATTNPQVSWVLSWAWGRCCTLCYYVERLCCDPAGFTWTVRHTRQGWWDTAQAACRALS